MQVAVIGGGAAGFFAALSVKEHHPHARVTIYEKSGKLLSKVRISGGGRCNVTHHCFENSRLAKHYPRGGKFLRKAFELFSTRDTVEWFAARGVQLKTEKDGRMFPVTDNSATIIDCLLGAAERAGVRIESTTGVLAVLPGSDGLQLKLSNGELDHVDRLIVATGGHPKPEAYQWLKDLGHEVVPPVPSLFTFNMPEEPVRELMGVVADPVQAVIAGTPLKSSGPLLITHWGMSGPAILKLSAWGARIIHDMHNTFTLRVNWLGGRNEEEVRNTFAQALDESGNRQVSNAGPFGLPARLWQHLLKKAEIPHDKRLGALAKKERDRLVDLLTNDRYLVKGKTTYKEEFVTAGGVALEGVDPKTMRSRHIPGLYFAGEVLDIDGITGGFNFQAAWTTGYLAGRLKEQ
jgi:predicted Rossmann fold flavoprotein